MFKNVFACKPALHVAEQRVCIRPVILCLADLCQPLAMCLFRAEPLALSMALEFVWYAEGQLQRNE